MAFSYVSKLGEQRSSISGYSGPCKPDPIKYTGFKPTATRKLCLSTIYHEPGFLRIRYSVDPDLYLWNNVYTVQSRSDERTVTVRYLNLELSYIYSHIFRIGNDTQYLLPPHSSIVEEFSNRFMELQNRSSNGRSYVIFSSRGTAYSPKRNYLCAPRTPFNPFRTSCEPCLH